MFSNVHRRCDRRTDILRQHSPRYAMHTRRAVKINGGVQCRCTFHKIGLQIDNCWSCVGPNGATENAGPENDEPLQIARHKIGRPENAGLENDGL